LIPHGEQRDLREGKKARAKTLSMIKISGWSGDRTYEGAAPASGLVFIEEESIEGPGKTS